MADDATTWSLIHAGRTSLASTVAELTPEQWRTPSLCAGWTVGALAAHLLASAEQTPGRFLAGMVTSGFRFGALMERDIAARAALTPEQVADRLLLRTTTTNKPPAPAVAMLGEVVVHSEDLRRPLGLPGRVDKDAADLCLDMYSRANVPVGGKRRIAGLRLVSTDTAWSCGDGPDVTGPATSLLLAMTGRSAGLSDLTGEGVPALRARL
ncbi:MAG: hypothetical protein JWN17_1897 [Frankiales bacterium]|nr:hypothetical protein [Frankiales bacterium]